MSKNPIRKDKTCLNCRHVVDLRYCPNCGQENTDTRKTFHHLFIHFFEDLTHYENAFWKTIRNLLFRPSALTKEYLSGKRLSYLAPVRLYIFISIVTFFLMAVIPEKEDSSNDIVNINNNNNNKPKKRVYNKFGEDYKKEAEKQRVLDSIQKDSIDQSLDRELKRIDELQKKGELSKGDAEQMKKMIKKIKKKKNDNPFNFGYSSIREMDSIRKVNPDEINDFEYWLNKKTIPINEKYDSDEIIEKFSEEATRNFPKTLFIYMPLFAFILWLLHSKKRWYYFDHGIFTLHYFSFLLLVALLLFLTSTALDYCGNFMVCKLLSGLIELVGYGWMVYYFFPAHHRFYGETRIVSFIKSCFIIFINTILFIILMLVFFTYTFINLH